MSATDYLTCWHPFGCQTPGDGCHGPCPVTSEEGQRIELEAYGEPTPAASRVRQVGQQQ